jgi:hypothetical protein
MHWRVGRRMGRHLARHNTGHVRCDFFVFARR